MLLGITLLPLRNISSNLPHNHHKGVHVHMPITTVTLQGIICSPSNTACSVGLGIVDMTFVSIDRLRSVARMRALNVQAVDEAALTDVFLPHLLPMHWHGQAFVPAGQAAEGPQPAWFCLLWRKLKVDPFRTMTVVLHPKAEVLQLRYKGSHVSMPGIQAIPGLPEM